MTDDIITIVEVDPENPTNVKVIMDYGRNKPRAESEFNAAHHCLRHKVPVRVYTGRSHYDVIVTDGYLEKNEAFDTSTTYILHLKGEIVNENN